METRTQTTTREANIAGHRDQPRLVSNISLVAMTNNKVVVTVADAVTINKALQWRAHRFDLLKKIQKNC